MLNLRNKDTNDIISVLVENKKLSILDFSKKVAEKTKALDDGTRFKFTFYNKTIDG